MNYLVSERFLSFQGEGVFAGKPAFFVRLHGCPVRCPWCDSKETWEEGHIRRPVVMTERELAEEAAASRVPLVVITGGEPCLYDLRPLIDFLVPNHRVVQIETSGALELKGDPDWVTVSPKRQMLPRPEILRLAGEVKIIVEKPEDIPFFLSLIEKDIGPATEVWLHPEWSHREDLQVLEAILLAVKNSHGYLRAGWQIHKLYQAR